MSLRGRQHADGLVTGEPLEPVGGPSISNGGTQGVTVQPQRDANPQPGGGNADVQNADAQAGDSLTFTVEFDDGSTRQYSVTL